MRAKRELEKRAPKLVELGKKTLILHGTKTSNTLNAVLTEIYHLKKDNAVKYSRRNDNIRPFESGGETSLEFYSLKTDCSLFVYGSHSKKRPDNLVIGRTYDHHIYDLVEVGVENFKSMSSCSYDKKIAPLIGSKPFFAFIGEGFENVEELKHLKEVLLDLFRGQVVSNLNLAGLDRVYVCTAVSSNKVLFTHCALRLKKSGTVVPRVELVEVGPSMDLVVRRHRLPDEGLKKEAHKIPHELIKKKEKNVSKDAIAGWETVIAPTKVRARLWMRFDRSGESEVFECDKTTIIKRAGIPARDLRILGPVFSNSSNILARERAMVVNLEYIKAIVTAEEVLLLDPLRQEVLPFVDQLRQQLSHKTNSSISGNRQLALRDAESNLSASGRWIPVPETSEGLQAELPFEFQVLEVALEVVCTYLDSSVADLERDAYPVLDELAKNVSTKNLERVRSLKSNLTRLLARVQKVRDELEHLLDDDEDMTQLYLTRKWLQNQQSEGLAGGVGSISFNNGGHHLRRLSSVKSGSMMTSANLYDDDVEDLEMLLEAYFMQLDGTRNKILSVREYIDDTEDYVNIQLDNQRNELIQLQLTLTIASFAIAIETLVAGLFGMNIPCDLYYREGIFEPFVGAITVASIMLFLIVLGYARWKKLLGS